MSKKYYLNDHGLVTYNELIKKKISELVSFDVSVLDELPDTGVDHILYLIPSKSELEENVRDEYLWVDEKWEMIGSTAIDLDNYYTKDEVDASIQNISINALNDSLIVNNSSISFSSDTSYIYLSTSDNKLLLNSSIITLADASNDSTGLAIAQDVYQKLSDVEEVVATSVITMANKIGLNSSLNLVWSEDSGLTEETIKDAVEDITESIQTLQTNKLDKNYTANKIYGTDSLGVQTVYTLGNGLAFNNGQIICNNSPIIPEETVGNDILTKTLEPNKVYIFESRTNNLTLTLGTPISGIVNEYHMFIYTGSSAPTITFPSGISWTGSAAPTIAASKTYEISILNKIAAYFEV